MDPCLMFSGFELIKTGKMQLSLGEIVEKSLELVCPCYLCPEIRPSSLLEKNLDNINMTVLRGVHQGRRSVLQYPFELLNDIFCFCQKNFWSVFVKQISDRLIQFPLRIRPRSARLTDLA